MTSKYIKFSFIIALPLFIFAIIYWKWHMQRYPSWKEEVKLFDGRVITVSQKRKYFDNYGTDQSWLTFSLPEMKGEQTWHSYLIPMHLDVYDGKVYIYGSPRGPKQLKYYKYPKSCIIPFTWNGSDFERIPFKAIPKEILKTENIYSCIPSKKSGTITQEEKNKEWCPPDGDNGQFTKEIDIGEYQKACDALSQLDRVQNRSD